MGDHDSAFGRIKRNKGRSADFTKTGGTYSKIDPHADKQRAPRFGDVSQQLYDGGGIDKPATLKIRFED